MDLPESSVYFKTIISISAPSSGRCVNNNLSLSLLPAWCLRNEGVSSVLLGTSNPEQLTENLGAIQVGTCAHMHTHTHSPSLPTLSVC